MIERRDCIDSTSEHRRFFFFFRFCSPKSVYFLTRYLDCREDETFNEDHYLLIRSGGSKFCLLPPLLRKVVLKKAIEKKDKLRNDVTFSVMLIIKDILAVQ